MTHLLTVDVEDETRAYRPSGGGACGAALDGAMAVFLEWLSAHRQTATFFVLAADAPTLAPRLREAVQAGHEIACHGLNHVRVDTLTPATFQRELQQAIAIIEDATQISCRGFRAPWFSARRGMKGFFAALAEQGIAYDSSLRVPLADANRCGDGLPVREIPVPLLPNAFPRLGVLGGPALRLLPATFADFLLERCAREGIAACVYLHPYEWHAASTADQPGLRRRCTRRWRISETLPRLARLSRTHPLTSISAWLAPRAPATQSRP